MDHEFFQRVSIGAAALVCLYLLIAHKRKPTRADILFDCFKQFNELKRLIDRASYNQFDHVAELIDDFTNTYKCKVDDTLLQGYTNELSNMLANKVIESGLDGSYRYKNNCVGRYC